VEEVEVVLIMTIYMDLIMAVGVGQELQVKVQMVELRAILKAVLDCN
jgi:hypothetical protein